MEGSEAAGAYIESDSSDGAVFDQSSPEHWQYLYINTLNLHAMGEVRQQCSLTRYYTLEMCQKILTKSIAGILPTFPGKIEYSAEIFFKIIK